MLVWLCVGMLSVGLILMSGMSVNVWLVRCGCGMIRLGLLIELVLNSRMLRLSVCGVL